VLLLFVEVCTGKLSFQMSPQSSTVSFKFSICLNNTLSDNKVIVGVLQHIDKKQNNIEVIKNTDNKSDV